MAKLIDPTFGINHQALSLLHFLENTDFPGEHDWTRHARTYPWYNGRETGFVLIISVEYLKPCLHLAFFEHRNSDSLCALMWEEPLRLNPPTVESSVELAYGGKDKWNVAKSVPYGQIGEMAEWAMDQVREFLREE